MLDILLVITVFIVAILVSYTIFGKKRESKLLDDTTDSYQRSVRMQEESIQNQREMLKVQKEILKVLKEKNNK
ncbi:hypothetical protein BTS2_2390 [Bacillus sp. TS-2]|nr:hypothetical protein BTS2_2390 [Bacillus sp. TS-2]